MKTVLIQRFTEEEQQFNTRLLSTFETMFSANSFNKLKDILHSKGTYFGKMNREKACGLFFTIFFGKDGCNEKFHMEVNKGISMDHIPGEVVLELRCSDFNPFTDDADRLNKEFGEAPDSSINEIIHRFAFSFKDEKIFSVRIPGKCIPDSSSLIYNN